MDTKSKTRRAVSPDIAAYVLCAGYTESLLVFAGIRVFVSQPGY
jgi:hypothetical protein